jgi:hypothetical protein
MLVFGEQVPRLWWVGAALMGVGCVLVGLREEVGRGKEKKDHVRAEDEPVALARGMERGEEGAGEEAT